MHHGIVDDENEHHRIVPGQWRQGVNLQDMEEVTAANRERNKDYTLNIILLQFTCGCNSMAK